MSLKRSDSCNHLLHLGARKAGTEQPMHDADSDSDTEYHMSARQAHGSQ